MPFVQSKTKTKQDFAYENDGYEHDQQDSTKSVKPSSPPKPPDPTSPPTTINRRLVLLLLLSAAIIACLVGVIIYLDTGFGRETGGIRKEKGP
ncbi:hypothetical protein NP493_1488g00016 [Ridgeia piscesae]|uniref:Uncharacterized protein n=1 Tax=Ridgeia piscesae TaxID=27915 RepID=A0AAD9NBZ9_RIDPI|nr:hypothetical protein NP493_1488g00016 [Ridgeia piscesae]